jgi:hypothetical protein
MGMTCELAALGPPAMLVCAFQMMVLGMGDLLRLTFAGRARPGGLADGVD